MTQLKSFCAISLFVMAFAAIALPKAHAQVGGGIPSYGVPGAWGDPYGQMNGSGMIMMNQACPYGGSVYGGISDDDPDLERAIDDTKEATERERDAERKFQDAKSAVERQEISMGIRGTHKDFESLILSCDNFVNSANNKKAVDDEKDTNKKIVVVAAKIDADLGLATSAAKYRCFKAAASLGSTVQMTQLCQESDFNGDYVFEPVKDTVNKWAKVPGNVLPGRQDQCVAGLNKLKELIKERNDLETNYTTESANRKANEELLKERKSLAAKDRARRLRDAAEAGDSGVAGCPWCGSMTKREKPSTSERLVTAGMGALDIGMRTYTNIRANHENARLGYPSSPNPFGSAAVFGLPYAYAGYYGSTQGGMTNGGFGCSPGIYGGGPYGGGPWGAGNMGVMGGGAMFNGMAYPYGGNMYMPGMFPGGYAGPWGVNGIGGGGQFGVLGMPGMMNGGFPWGVPGAGGGIAGGCPFCGPGMGNMGPFAGGQMVGGGSMMGGPFGPFMPGGGQYGMAGPSLYGNIGGSFGMGGSPYGMSPFGMPYGGGGGAFGNIGYPYGMPGAGGMMGGLGPYGIGGAGAFGGGGGFGQMNGYGAYAGIQAQYDMYHRIQTANELMQQANSYTSGIGAGGYSGYGGMPGGGFSLGGYLSGGIGGSFGGGGAGYNPGILGGYNNQLGGSGPFSNPSGLGGSGNIR